MCWILSGLNNLSRRSCIIQRPELAACKAELARQHLEQHLSSRTMAQQHITLYQQALAAH